MASEKSDERLSALEQKYIELLERRVQELETKLTHGKTTQSNIVSVSSDSEKNEIKKAGTPNKKDSEDSEMQTNDEKEKKPEDDGRYRVVISEYDPSVDEYVERTNDGPMQRSKKAEKSKRAFTFRKNRKMKTIGGVESRKFDGSEVDIESLQLQNLLGKVMLKLDAGKSKVTDMSSPFQDLLWCWDEANDEAATIAELEEAIKSDFKDVDAEQQAKLDLRALLDIISTSSGDETLDMYFRNKDTMEESRTITFWLLWTLFPTGSFIISRPFLDHSQVFVVQSCNIPDEEETEPKLVVTAFSYDWNGTTFNRVPYKFTIDEFKDKKAIFEQPFYPLQHYRKGGITEKSTNGLDNTKDIDKLKSELIERGKTFFSYCVAEKGKQMFRYDGRAFYASSGGLFRPAPAINTGDSDAASTSGDTAYATESETVGSNCYVKGTVVVDFKSYYEYQPESAQRLGMMDPYFGIRVCSCSECRSRFEALHRFSWDKKSKEEDMLDEKYMMFPPRVLGYALDQKRWVHLDVKKLQPLKKADSKNFDEKLILSQNNKDLIKKSVQAHGQENVVDYTPGKGKGLILLLWGVPGVGKTLTAESVALLAGKPLFSIGASDIGTESNKVEANLQRVFALAGLWEAVLLLYVAPRLDEADVFLEGRDSRGSNIHRNTMVSVLLRILEYYEGILILTTNRVRSFDIAVQSRIHIAIEYKELGEEEKEKIFIDFLKQLKDKKFIRNWEECKEWVEEEGRIKPFNGRQIRNTVYTAMGLAHADKRSLEKRDLVLVARNTELFKKTLSDQEAIYRNNQIR